MSTDVLCIGDAVYDISMFLSDYPAENSKSEISDMLESGGGPAANAAYLLALWKVPCAIAALIGDDRYGALIADEFASVGVDTSLLELRPGHPTPVSVILVNTGSGSRTIINRKTADAVYRPDRTAMASLQPKVLLFDGHELAASLDALGLFPDAVSILDAGSLREGTEALAHKVDYLVSSERFALQMTGLSDLNEETNQRGCIDQLLEKNRRTVVVTLGERGLIYCGESGFGRLPAYDVEAVDSTAAGDIFHGAFAYAILQKMSFDRALKFASMAAAISVTRRGGRVSTPPCGEALGLEKVEKPTAGNTTV